MFFKIAPLAGTALALALTLTGGARADDDPIVIRGWLEHALVVDAGMEMDAKLDTGALTASLDAEILSDPDVDDVAEGETQTVVFEIANEDGESATLEREITRIVRVKRTDGSVEERYVVVLAICLGMQKLDVEFGLSDRSSLNYPMLIGRRALESAHIVVRSDQEYVAEPDCAIGETE